MVQMWMGAQCFIVAPEPQFVQLFKQTLGSGYVTGDLNSPLAKGRLDVTDIQYPDEVSTLFIAVMFWSMFWTIERPCASSLEP